MKPRTRAEQLQHLRDIRDFSFDDTKRLAAALLLSKADNKRLLTGDDIDEVEYIYTFIKGHINLDLDVLFPAQ